MTGVLTLASIIGIGASSIANAVLSALSNWVSAGAGELVRQAGAALESSAAVPLNSGFDTVFSSLRSIGAVIASCLFAVAVLHAVIRRDLAELGRIVLIRMPLALMLSGAALEIVVLALAGTDQLASELFATANSSALAFPGAMASLLGPGGAAVTSGFEEFAIAIVVAVVSLTLWIELVIRSSAIAVAALFIPLALAGAIWQATASWSRRLAETLGALIVSKLVMVGVITLAISELGEPTGADGLVQGVALLLLAALAPFALLRLIPAIEGGAIAHLEGVGRRVGAAVVDLPGSIGDAVAGPGPDFAPSVVPPLALHEGTNLNTPEFEALVEEQRARINAISSGRDSSPGTGASEEDGA